MNIPSIGRGNSDAENAEINCEAGAMPQSERRSRTSTAGIYVAYNMGFWCSLTIGEASRYFLYGVMNGPICILHIKKTLY